MLVFDAKLWGGRDVGDNSQFWKRATIMSVHWRTDDQFGSEGWVATVQFHYDGRTSRGHFISAMKEVPNGR